MTSYYYKNDHLKSVEQCQHGQTLQSGGDVDVSQQRASIRRRCTYVCDPER